MTNVAVTKLRSEYSGELLLYVDGSPPTIPLFLKSSYLFLFIFQMKSVIIFVKFQKNSLVGN